MEAASKQGCSGDRLSALSDDLLGRVLSLLPSRQAVQTSVLSRRWADLWRTVPAINLVMADFGEPVDDIKETWLKMEDFTANLLMRHRAPLLDTFRLDFSFSHFFHLDRSRDIDRWIRRGFEYRPSVLELRLPWRSRPRHRLPHLRASHLKVLHLFSVSLDHAFEDQLRSGCPVLEDLVISMCYNQFGTIQSNSLKKLTVDFCSSTVADMLVIKAPYLAFLRLYFNRYENGVLLDTGNSLVEALIFVSPNLLPPVTEAVLLGCVFNVTSLELGGFSSMVYLSCFASDISSSCIST